MAKTKCELTYETPCRSSKMNNSGILILSAERTIPMCVLKIGTTAKGFRHRFKNLTNQNENSQLYGLSIKLYRSDKIFSTVGSFSGIWSPDDTFSPAGTEEATAQLTVPSQNSSDLTQVRGFLTVIIRRVFINLMQCLDRPQRRCLLSWLEQDT